MAKTKTLGIRTTPQLIDELEGLKKAFEFDSYAEMLSSLAQVLKAIDQRVTQIPDHPRTWSLQDIHKHLGLPHEGEDEVGEEISQLVWRRLEQRFGEDGIEALRHKLSTTEQSDQP